MRLWTLHPQYLDSRGLVALWRESLLALAALKGKTQGYRHHPQLQRFQAAESSCSALNAYLLEVLAEAQARGFAFDRSKVTPVRKAVQLPTTTGQIDYEWQHLLRKLQARSPAIYERWRTVRRPEPHPIFLMSPGPVEPWERVTKSK